MSFRHIYNLDSIDGRDLGATTVHRGHNESRSIHMDARRATRGIRRRGVSRFGNVAISSVEQNGSGPQELQPQTPSLPPGNIAEQSICPRYCVITAMEAEARGSGVIVDPQGYILTAKHVVDPKWTSWAYEKAPTTPRSTIVRSGCRRRILWQLPKR